MQSIGILGTVIFYGYKENKHGDEHHILTVSTNAPSQNAGDINIFNIHFFTKKGMLDRWIYGNMFAKGHLVMLSNLMTMPFYNPNDSVIDLQINPSSSVFESVSFLYYPYSTIDGKKEESATFEPRKVGFINVRLDGEIKNITVISESDSDSILFDVDTFLFGYKEKATNTRKEVRHTIKLKCTSSQENDTLSRLLSHSVGDEIKLSSTEPLNLNPVCEISQMGRDEDGNIYFHLMDEQTKFITNVN